MDELGKCMAGEYYDCHDEVFLEFKCTARRLLAQCPNGMKSEAKRS